MRYQGIIKASLVDGIGWRTVLFVSGCEHHCPGCHNQQTWDRNSGEFFGPGALRVLLKALDRPEIDGLTISGGDPLMPYNREGVEALLAIIKQIYPDKTIWIYTGYEWDQVKDLSLMQYVDVLVDGKFLLEKRDTTIAFRGSPNQRIIDVQKSLAMPIGPPVELHYE